MDRNLRRFPASGGKRAGIAALLLAAGALASAHASTYQLTDLVTDDLNNLTSLGLPAAGVTVDPNLVNPWGVSFTPTTSPFWISDNGAGLTSLYTATGNQIFPVSGTPPTPVMIAPPGGSPPGFVSAPTGQVFNSAPGATDFSVTSNGQTGKASFIFATEDGTISGWPGSIRPQQTFIAVDHSRASPTSPLGTGAVYKGLAMATSASGTFLYAANFRAGTVDVFDTSFKPANGFSFADPNPLPPLPAGTPAGHGWAPFNIQLLNGNLYVAYAVQNSDPDPTKDKHDDVAGAGNGFVDEFDTKGNFITRVATGGVLDSPWGLAIAPAGFGAFARDLLVGNFGNGEINVFAPNTNNLQPLGTLLDSNGDPIEIADLWALTIGNSGTGVDPNAIYFTAGLQDEMHGLFGNLSVVPEPGSLALLATGLAGLMWFWRRRRSPSIPS